MEIDTLGYDLEIAVNDFHLSYDDVGKGEIPFIFLHGFPFSKDMWRNQLEFLKSTNRAIACDIRGFGKSKVTEAAMSIELFAEDLIKFMGKLEIEKAILCGLSMGGFIALNAMKRFPDRFDALILCDTNCLSDSEKQKQDRYKTINEISDRGANDFYADFITKVFHPNSILNKKDIVDDLNKVVVSNAEYSITRGWAALAERNETCSILNQITIPTMIICGREDMVTPLSQSQYMNENIPGSTLAIIDKAGHVSNLEKPEEFNQLLLSFLTTLRGVDLEDILEDTPIKKESPPES